MLTWQLWLKFMRKLEPRKQVKSLLLSGFLFITLSACFTFMWKETKLSSEDSWSRTPAKIVSKAETWKSDKSLYTFTIKFQTAHGKYHTPRLYAEKLYYDAANIDFTTPLFVDLDTTERIAKVKRIITPSGMFLYDSVLEEHITKRHNTETSIAVLLFLSLGVICLTAAATINYRTNKAPK